MTSRLTLGNIHHPFTTQVQGNIKNLSLITDQRTRKQGNREQLKVVKQGSTLYILYNRHFLIPNSVYITNYGLNVH